MSEIKDNLYAMRHSLAHIMATAIQQKWPDAKFGVGPVVENGFYYDVDLGEVKISEEDFATLEKVMHKIIKANDTFEKFELPIDKAIDWAEENNQPYKQELLNDLKRSGTTLAKDLDKDELGAIAGEDSAVKKVSFYKNGGFTDLCRGPHIESTGNVGAFKLMRVSGAYWRGKEDNPQMQRIYGVAFKTDKELRTYLNMLEEAKKRDHRKLGQELDLFTFSDMVGGGLTLWTPKGTYLRRGLDNFIQEMRDEYGYQEVTSPHITKKELFETSGHWAKFSEELFKIKTREGHEFAMKPMSCPMHAQIYASRPRSYRELPIRYRETAFVYRDEQSGELAGLSRVRCITQDDAHVFCRTGQVVGEALKIWDIVDRFYKTLGFSDLRVRFSTHSKDEMASYAGSEQDWLTAESQLLEIIKDKVGDNYALGVGEAAFYGPKIDFMSRDALGREWQVATIQLDFNQPESFNLTCANEKGDDERILMIHAAIMGSIERFLSVYIEHTAGRFPIWLASEQLRIITVNQEEETVAFAEGIVKKAKELGVRVYLDNDNESVGKKIRQAELQKVPLSIVIGQKEIDSGEVTPRVRQDLEASGSYGKTIKAEQLLSTVVEDSTKRKK